MRITKIILALAVSLFSISSFADTYVQPYQKRDGTNVQGHYRTDPNNTRNDNWSTKGNRNPYTGEEGTKNPQNNRWN